MPSSAAETIPYIIEFIRKNRPDLRSVLDVGIGFGKGGFLLREYFDAKRDQHFQPSSWQLKITGVEIYRPYISSLQRLIYDEIKIGDILELLPGLGKYDLAILSDVLEHFPKEKGFRLLSELFKHVEEIVISTPLGFKAKSVKRENPHEAHLSGWIPDDFGDYSIIDQATVPRIRKREKELIVYLRKKPMTEIEEKNRRKL